MEPSKHQLRRLGLWFMEEGYDFIENNMNYTQCTNLVFKIKTTRCLKRLEKYNIAEICHYFRGIMQDVHSGIYYILTVIFNSRDDYPDFTEIPVEE